MSAPVRMALLFVAFTGASLFLLEPGLHLPFFSDDIGYVQYNEFVHALSLENVVAILDPWGQPARDSANYAPVHLLAHALEWSVFGNQVEGYHLVNLLLHAAAAVLLVELLHGRGLPLAAAVFGGAIFAVHPANVETVLWIFQLKTLLALVFAMGALLVRQRHPAVGTALFALALLSKIPALFALPVAFAFDWLSGPDRAHARRERRWIVAWIAIALLCSVPQFAAFDRGVSPPPLGRDIPEIFRTMVAIGGRYVAMAYTGAGTSPFHAPDAADSFADPWWLFGGVAAVCLAALLLSAFRSRREAAAWWLWAAAAYAPISQLFPFRYPMGDRYLYFVLPGLIGGTAFAVRDAWPRIAAFARSRGVLPPSPRTTLGAAAATATVLVVLFAVLAREQARVWRLPMTVMIAAAENYPNGLPAQQMRVYKAAGRGDAASAAAALRAARARGFDSFMDIETDAHYAAVRRDPDFDAALRDIAGDWIATIRARDVPTHYETYWLAQAHVLRDELREAEAALDRALEIGGDFDSRIRAQLIPLRDELRRRDAAAAAKAGVDEGADGS